MTTSQTFGDKVAEIVDSRWKGLFIAGGVAAFSMFLLMIIQIIVFEIWPPRAACQPGFLSLGGIGLVGCAGGLSRGRGFSDHADGGWVELYNRTGTLVWSHRSVDSRKPGQWPYEFGHQHVGPMSVAISDDGRYIAAG